MEDRKHAAGLMDDRWYRRLIVVAVCLVIGASVGSQLLMQFGGGPRDEPMDLSDQIGEDFQGLAIFPDGLPPFISSGGLFYPEKAIFDWGLGLGGIVFCILAIELTIRTQRELISRESHRLRTALNLGQFIAALVVGISLVMLTQYPFHLYFLNHLLVANGIFYGSMVWGGLLTLARSGLDGKIQWQGFSLNHWRWLLVVIGVASYFLMTGFGAQRSFHLSALFEWLLTLSSEAITLTLLLTGLESDD